MNIIPYSAKKATVILKNPDSIYKMFISVFVHNFHRFCKTKSGDIYGETKTIFSIDGTSSFCASASHCGAYAK